MKLQLILNQQEAKEIIKEYLVRILAQVEGLPKIDPEVEIK